MKKNENIRNILGISQEIFALLLQVSRSQIAMYELGKRSLPIHATIKLTKYLLLIKNYKIKTNNKDNSVILKKPLYEMLLQKNKYQQIKIDKEISTISKKHKSANSSKEIISYLTKKENNISKKDLTILNSIITKKKNAIIYNYETIYLKLQLKKEVLKYEEKLLEKELKTYKN